MDYLRDYPDVFIIDKNPYTEDIDGVILNPDLTTFQSRTERVAQVLEDMREKDTFLTLEGWRNEVCNMSCNHLCTY